MRAELVEVGQARAGVVVALLEQRLVEARGRRSSCPAQSAWRPASVAHAARPEPGHARRWRARRVEAPRAPRSGTPPPPGSASARRAVPGRCRAAAAADAKAGDAVARVLGPAQDREHVLDVRRLEELEPAELHERDVAAARARSRAGRCGARRGTAPPARAAAMPASRLASTRAHDVVDLGRSRRRTVASRGFCAGARAPRTGSCVALRGEARSPRWRRRGSAGSSGSSARA